MSKLYLDKPLNFSLIDSILISEKKVYFELLITSRELYFYDTCSFQCHSNSINRKKIIKFIKANGGTIIITQSVLSELGGTDGYIKANVLAYINEINTKGIKIILIKEEDSLYIIRNLSYLSYEESNVLLGRAATSVKQNKNCITNIVNSFDLGTKVFSDKSKSALLYKEFFQFARSKKASGDSLAEELIFIIFIIFLSSALIPKIIFLSNDKRSLSSVIGMNDYTQKYYEGRKIYHLTTTKLIDKLYKTNLITSKEEFKELLDVSYSQDNVKVYYTDKYSINEEFNSFTKIELINRVFDEDEFNILF
jgi:hypothetical protein